MHKTNDLIPQIMLFYINFFNIQNILCWAVVD